MLNGRVKVEAPVYATVGTFYLRLFPHQAWQTAVDDYDERPWAWVGMVRIKFQIGELTTTKKVKARYAYTDKLGWPLRDRPDEAALERGKSWVLAQLRHQIGRHGIPAYEITVIETYEEESVAAGG